jgi:hypothetical protein
VAVLEISNYIYQISERKVRMKFETIIGGGGGPEYCHYLKQNTPVSMICFFSYIKYPLLVANLQHEIKIRYMVAGV